MSELRSVKDVLRDWLLSTYSKVWGKPTVPPSPTEEKPTEPEVKEKLPPVSIPKTEKDTAQPEKIGEDTFVSPKPKHAKFRRKSPFVPETEGMPRSEGREDVKETEREEYKPSPEVEAKLKELEEINNELANLGQENASELNEINNRYSKGEITSEEYINEVLACNEKYNRQREGLEAQRDQIREEIGRIERGE